VAGDELAGAGMSGFQRHDIMITRQEQTAVPMGLGELRKGFCDVLKSLSVSPAGIDRIHIVAEKSQSGTLLLRQGDGPLEENKVLMHVRHDEHGKFGIKFERARHG
jgi:hypothetical protein